MIREEFDEKGNHVSIEIKKEFLLDYLAARNLYLKLSYYRQRVENVALLENSPYSGLSNVSEERDNGRFELLIRDLNSVYGGSWHMTRIWNEIDDGTDVPIVLDEASYSENRQGTISGYEGIRIEGEFWRDEWIEHQRQSTRIRRDIDKNLPNFIIETDGSRMNSSELNNEDIGRWLWFRSGVMNEFLKHRGFTFDWHTAYTGSLYSTSGYNIHFGINEEDLINVYAYDIARLNAWEQRIWAAYNVSPIGKVCKELLDSQVRVQPTNTMAVEDLLFKVLKKIELNFKQTFHCNLFTQDFDIQEQKKVISRFNCIDESSLLTLAKELIRIFSDRLNKDALRSLSNHKDKKQRGSNKLLQDVVSQYVGEDKAYEIFTPIIGVYDMRLGDAHPTSSKINDALNLAGIDNSLSYLKQGEQLIRNFGQAIWFIGAALFSNENR
ncbi:hypothetical protein ACKLNO_04055 [Neisseriaceae bacterium B1]